MSSISCTLNRDLPPSYEEAISAPAIKSRQSAILLWSEHSERCAKLRQMISNEQLHLFDKVCIDNDQIRTMICGSERLQIRFLPCFLVFDEQKNIIAKFEGDGALEWFAKNIQRVGEPNIQKLSFPRAILGQWKFGNYSMILSANMSDGFVIKRCHLGDVIFNPSEIEWKGEKFHWEMKKSGNHTTDSRYCYDPSIPNTIIETNSGSKNTFIKLKL